VHFITFNYDASLEYNLFQALTAIDLFKPTDVQKFLNNDRIIHVYGSVHRGIPTMSDSIDLEVVENLAHPFEDPLNFARDFEPKKVLLDRCAVAAENLRTIDPHDKEADKASLEHARQWINDSDVIYILGYGFDANNNRRIGLDPSLHGSKKTVMFTNLGDINTINKKASKLFFGNPEYFLSQSVFGNPKSGGYFEKSVRTVYEALEKDFDALEGELIAGSKI
jgi:hypothetical protein